MMAMKDLFCLVNAFMNRNKSTEEDRQIEVPIEAAEDTRVLPGAKPNSSSAKVKRSGLLSTLEPYQHLLPDLCGMDLVQQKKLQKALYSAGVSATLSLHKLLQDVPKRKSSENTNPDDFFPDDIDGREILEHLSKSVAQEDPAKTFRKMSQNMDEIMQKMDGGKMLMNMISNELAAASLAAFASVTLRKPLTKQVESMMQTTQEMCPQNVDDETDEVSESSTQPHELKRSASAGKTAAAPPGDSSAAGKGGKQRTSTSCTRHNKDNGNHNRDEDEEVPEEVHKEIAAILELEQSSDVVNVDCDEDEELSFIGSEPVEDEMEDEDSLFRYVCAAGYEDLAKLLVSMRNSAEFAQPSESTPLMEACCGGHADVVRTLIEAGADVNTLSSTRNTALIYACASGHIECVKELLNSGRCDLTIRNEAGHDAMMEAANIGNVDIMKLLVQRGAKPSCIVDSVDYKESALTLASYKGHCEAVEFLLSLMSKDKKTAQEDEELHTALMEAAMDGHVDVAKLLLKNGAKVNLSSENFENPLTLASCGGHIEMVKLLCNAGANLEEPNDEGYTPLMEASREGHFEVVKYLLDKGAKVNAKIDDGIETSLTLAASGGFKNVVELLVKFGGDLTIGDRTPLYEACQEGHTDVAQFIVECLCKNKTRDNKTIKDLNDALLCAAGIDNVELCKVLIKAGAQVDCFSKENRTPLMEASRQNCLNVVELLIKNGADVNKIAPGATKELDPNTGAPKTKGGSKKLTQKDCCPTLKCPCCIPPSLQKSAKEVCTAAGIPPAPYSTTSSSANASPMATMTMSGGGKRPAAPSRSSTPSAHKCLAKGSAAKVASAVNKPQLQQNSLSTSSSSVTLSDPAAWMDNTPTCDAQNNNNDTALTLACVGGHTSLVNLLISKGAQIEHRDKKGFTPLILAATGGHTEICSFLITAGAQVDAQADRTKDTALSMACSGGRKDVVELLLKHNANKEHRNLSDYTPLSLAASGGYVDIIQLLLKHGAEINSRTNSKLGISPLMLAAMNGHVEATRVLLEKGSDINAQIETNKNTALTLACFQGRAEVARLLIQFNANVEHRAKTGLTPLMEAANGGYIDVGRVLIEAQADVNTSPVPTSRDTALTIAADKGHHDFVTLLLEHDAQLNARNKKGCTALWLACNGGHLETVKVLIAKGADTEAQDNRKLTPLMVAFRKGHHKVVKYLVEHVAQFPSDADCQRFILTQTDQDLIAKCTQCIQYIKEAKAKQAEQANKAAASLLEMLAQEEAQEESRKRTKQRQKEKKKAKKQAAKKSESPTRSVPSNETTTVATMESESQQLVEETQEEEKIEEKEEEEVPEKEQEVVKPPQMQIPAPSTEHKTKQKKQTAAAKQKNAQTAQKEVPKKTENALTASKTSEDEEWLRASKKRASLVKPSESKPSVPSSTPATTSKPISTAQQPVQPVQAVQSLAQIPPLFPEDTILADQLSGRRPSLQVLNIPANSIPRVIGRSGVNVNTIREATGAQVEVEKQSLRKEQTYRKITIKGLPEAVKSAVKMVELLMKDHNLTINEILDRVLIPIGGPCVVRKSPSLSISSDTPIASLLETTRTPPIAAPSPPLASAKEELRKLSIHQQTPLLPSKKKAATPELVPKNVPASTNATPTTNVWQKRAEAIREKKTPRLNLAVGENPYSANSLSSFSPTTSERNTSMHDLNGSPSAQLPIGYGRPQSDPEKLLTLPQPIGGNSSGLAALSNEEHQRKAPGYARPLSSTSTNQQQQLQNSNEKMSSDDTMPSLTDPFASLWSKPLDFMEELDSSTGVNIQNSWSYLLEDRSKKAESTGLQSMPPDEPTRQPSAGMIWQNSQAREQPSQFPLTSTGTTSGIERNSASYTPVKVQKQPPPMPSLQSAALSAQAAIQQQQYQRSQQAQWQQQQANSWQMAPPTFVTPLMPTANGPPHSDNGIGTSSPYHHQQMSAHHPHPPPGFGMGNSQHVLTSSFPGQHQNHPFGHSLGQQQPQQQSPHLAFSSTLPGHGLHQQQPQPNSASPLLGYHPQQPHHPFATATPLGYDPHQTNTMAAAAPRFATDMHQMRRPF